MPTAPSLLALIALGLLCQGGLALAPSSVLASGESAEVPVDVRPLEVMEAPADPAQLVSRVAPSVFRLAVFDGDKQLGNGTGFAVRQDGILVTNHHVIAMASSEFFAIGHNGVRHRVLGVLADDEAHDVAIIKVEANGLTPLSLASSSSLRVGQPAFILGSSHGLDQSLGVGNIAALRDALPKGLARRTEGGPILGPFVQHTAVAAPGSSGSPLMNARGEVIGVHHSGFSDSEISFAARVDVLAELLDKTDLAAQPKSLGPNVTRNLIVSLGVVCIIGMTFVWGSRSSGRRTKKKRPVVVVS